MEYTVNQQNIQKYAERLTNDLCRQFFINKAFISGPEILSFNADNQLNLLIVKNIFLNWQKEVLKLKSPFFDYEDIEVKQELKSFMNKLSNHIKVYRYDFEPIVQKSISDFILLAAAPQDFFKKEIETLAGPKISVALLKDFSKYIKINRFVIDQVISEIEASGYSETFGGETIRFVMKSLSENPDKIEAAEISLNGLFEQLPAEVTEFVYLPKPLVTRPAFLDDPKPETPRMEPIKMEAPKQVIGEEQIPEFETPKIIAVEEEFAPEPVQEIVKEPNNDLFFASEQITAPDSEIEINTEETVIQSNETVEQIPFETVEEEPLFQKVEPILKTAKPKISKSEVFEMSKDPINLNDTLRMSEERSNLAQTLQTKTLSAPFKTLVPMHYRFTFINSLFGGNQQAWADAVEKIDKTEAYEEAIEMLKKEFGEKFNWDQEEGNVAILFNYVERKF